MARCAIQHNGLLHVAWPVAALALRLVAPPHATPVMSCAPTPCACGMAHLRQATRGQPLASAVSAAPKPQRVLARRCARSVELAPAHPVGPGACAPLARAGRWPVRPPRGLPPPPALGCVVALGKRGACAGRRSRLAGASPGKQPNSLHGAARRAPAVAHQPHPSLLARVRQRGQAVKAKPQPFGLRCCAALTAWPR